MEKEKLKNCLDRFRGVSTNYSRLMAEDPNSEAKFILAPDLLLRYQNLAFDVYFDTVNRLSSQSVKDDLNSIGQMLIKTIAPMRYSLYTTDKFLEQKSEANKLSGKNDIVYCVAIGNCNQCEHYFKQYGLDYCLNNCTFCTQFAEKTKLFLPSVSNEIIVEDNKDQIPAESDLVPSPDNVFVIPDLQEIISSFPQSVKDDDIKTKDKFYAVILTAKKTDGSKMYISDRLTKNFKSFRPKSYPATAWCYTLSFDNTPYLFGMIRYSDLGRYNVCPKSSHIKNKITPEGAREKSDDKDKRDKQMICLSKYCKKKKVGSCKTDKDHVSGSFKTDKNHIAKLFNLIKGTGDVTGHYLTEFLAADPEP